MACFVVTAGEAVVVTGVQVALKVMEHKGIIKYHTNEEGKVEGGKWSKKVGVLNGMLWGGSFLLALEHVFHGEVVPFPPFLSALSSPGDTAEMLHEMGTVGVAMAVALTAVWGIGLLVMHLVRRKRAKAAKNSVAIEAK